MPIEKTSVILRDAEANQYGVCAFNVFNFESIHWAVEVAEEEKIPVIVEFYPGFSKYITMDIVADIAKRSASEVTVPVGLHLDHCISLEEASAGIRAGFSSVMIDGSGMEYKGNIEVTRKVVKIAHKMGVEVEAELGYVGSGSLPGDFTNTEHFTDPFSAAEFLAKTDADSLAISIGNAHGQYAVSPDLDFGRLAEIRKRTGATLVLHGGSGIPDEQLHESIRLGISKFNFATEYDRTFYESIRKLMMEYGGINGSIYRCLKNAKSMVKEWIRAKICVLNPNHYRL